MNQPPGVLKVLLAVAGIALAARPSPAQLTVEPPAIDFGERGQNERPEASLTLANRGQSPVMVREIKKSCDCLTIASFPQVPGPIPPGGEIKVRISMGSGRAMGRLDKWITIVSQDGGRPELKVPISMRVLDEFSMEPRDVRFEGVAGGEPQRASIDVTLRRGAPPTPVRLEVRGIQARFNRPSDGHLRATVAPILGGQRITLELDPRHPEGPISAEVEASLNGKSLYIPVSGEMFAWIKVSPNYVNFSRAIESDPSSTVREVVLTATDGKPFKVLEVGSRPARSRERSVRLEFALASVEPAAGREGAPPADREASPGHVSPEKAPGAAPSSKVHRIICRAFRGEGDEPTFFGTVTIRTDHPQKPEISLKYSGFFASPARK